MDASVFTKKNESEPRTVLQTLEKEYFQRNNMQIKKIFEHDF